MLAHLLPYKYKALKFADQYSEKAVVQLGWKARKYIRWKDVHVGEDRELLKSFGDLAVEDGKIDEESFPRISEILLNTQYWRLDKEDWSIEPPHEPAWDKANELILSANESPNVVISYLAEMSLSTEQLSSNNLYKLFEHAVFCELVLAVRKYNGKVDYVELVELDFESTLRNLQELLPDHTELKHSIREPFNDIGLPSLEKDDSLSSSCKEFEFTKQTIVSFEKMSTSKLFRISEESGNVVIYLNENNKSISHARESDVCIDYLKRFMAAYAKTCSSNPALSESLNDFNSYLAMNLNREFG
jgi:hypothetical protein